MSLVLSWQIRILFLFLFWPVLNVLWMQDYTAKLSDFGLAKDVPQGDETHVSTRIMGTHGYAAPEYIMTGEYLLCICFN